MAEEQILVIERKVFEQAGAFQGVCSDVDRYLNAFFTAGVCRWMARPLAEQDPAYKQLIPYVLMRCGDRWLTYVRGKRAGETRLAAKRSMGIGGHINPIDDGGVPLFADYRDIYKAAVQREVTEEVQVDTTYTDRVAALINDDSNEVGKVHLGVVHIWDLQSEQVAKKEQMITQMEFMSPDELAAVRDSMETWSQICFDHLCKRA